MQFLYINLYPSVLLNSFISFNSISIWKDGGVSLGFLYTQDHTIFLSNLGGFLLNFCQNSTDRTSSTVLDRVARADILVCWSDLRDKAFSVSPLVWHLLWSHRCLLSGWGSYFEFVVEYFYHKEILVFCVCSVDHFLLIYCIT